MMTYSQVTYESVKALVAETLCARPEGLTPETRLGDIGASLDFVELLLACEEEFKLNIPDADTEAIVTVGDLADYLKRRRAESTR